MALAADAADGFPYSGSAKQQARVSPSQVLVANRYGHECVQRRVVSGEKREGREVARCAAVVSVTVAASMLRCNGSTVCVFAVKFS